jgi:hypothetical protein
VEIWDAFDGLNRAFGTYQVREIDGQKLSGSAKTVQQPLDQDIWDLHLSGERSLGVIPIRDDNTVAFAAIDIDTYPLDLESLEQKINDMGLPLIVCRSKSGGAHLYLFIRPPGAMAEVVRGKLAEWAAELGFSGVEIFPKQNELRNKDDVGNWINMPYFGGDADELRYAILDGKPASMSKFILNVQLKAITNDELTEFEIDFPEMAILDGGPPCLNTLMREGFPQGNRNISLFNLGVYCKKRFGDDWQDKLDEFNETLLSPPLSLGEVAQVKRNLDKKAYFYKCNDAPINALCQKTICAKKAYGIGGDGFSDDLVKVEGSIRMMTEEVYHIATINGKRVYLNAHSMCGQHAFRIAVMTQTGYLVPNMKPKVFNTIVQQITSEAQEVEAPKYSGKRGELIQEVLHIASGSNVAENWTQCMSGLPMPDDRGGVFLHPHQLVKILKRRLKRHILEPQVLLEALLGDGVAVKEKKVGGRVFWYLEDIKLLQAVTEDEVL